MCSKCTNVNWNNHQRKVRYKGESKIRKDQRNTILLKVKTAKCSCQDYKWGCLWATSSMDATAWLGSAPNKCFSRAKTVETLQLGFRYYDSRLHLELFESTFTGLIGGHDWQYQKGYPSCWVGVSTSFQPLLPPLKLSTLKSGCVLMQKFRTWKELLNITFVRHIWISRKQRENRKERKEKSCKSIVK